MDNLVCNIPWTGSAPADPELLRDREWLVTNGLGGYASGLFPGGFPDRITIAEDPQNNNWITKDGAPSATGSAIRYNDDAFDWVIYSESI
jgi:hypothetical protein